ncbi:hypothetical protein LPW11_06075 [Geomonas sp. RF6]|uniref:hypothetical protein n=1 Tax=Geomonas sp. RF6 TaxID=2897342 RepID=UPI001E639A19|nr:hypothetical protein [Geomonas sp. RF6]UFS71757.1 hypothetical protein LPW11_06075 [Geomonas sp. RF6]
MKCEFCGKWMRQGDIVHGLKYGTLERTGFTPARDSAVTVICGPCSMEIYRIIYGRLENHKVTFPVMFKMHEELSALMKNGYKFVQNMAKLPRTELVALQQLIAICKVSR